MSRVEEKQVRKDLRTDVWNLVISAGCSGVAFMMVLKSVVDLMESSPRASELKVVLGVFTMVFFLMGTIGRALDLIEQVGAKD